MARICVHKLIIPKNLLMRYLVYTTNNKWHVYICSNELAISGNFARKWRIGENSCGTNYTNVVYIVTSVKNTRKIIFPGFF